MGSAFGTRRVTRGPAAAARATPRTPPQTARTHALGQELPHEALAPRAHGGAHGELLAPADRARQQQAREVRAADQKHAGGRPEERHQEQARLRRHLIPQAQDRRADAMILLGVRALELRRHETHLRPGLFERDSLLQPRDASQVTVAPVGEIVGGELKGSPDVGAAGGKPEVGRHHAHDDVRRVVEEELAAEDVRVAAEAPPPETVGDHDRFLGAGPAVRLGQDPAERRPDTKDLEEVGRRQGAVEPLRIALAGQIHGSVGVGGHALERAARALPVAVVGGRELRPPVAVEDVVLPEVDESVPLGKRERADEHVIQNRIARRRRSDPDAGDDDRRRGEPGRARQGTRRVADVLPQDIQRASGTRSPRRRRRSRPRGRRPRRHRAPPGAGARRARRISSPYSARKEAG